MENKKATKVDSGATEIEPVNASEVKTDDTSKQANAKSTWQNKTSNVIDLINTRLAQQEGMVITPLLVNKLIESGAHIGLPRNKWNPKMSPFIYKNKKRVGNHVIDMYKSLTLLNNAYFLLQEITRDGGKVLIVGTRGRYVQNLIQSEAERTGSYYITQRWLGGTLTNFEIIQKSIRKLNQNELLISSDGFGKYSKKEQVAIEKETEKLNKFYGGIKTMKKLPSALIVVDPVGDKNAIAEANKMGIPVIALANTNADPEFIDHIIPVNTFAHRTNFLIISILCDAIASSQEKPTKVIGRSEEEIVLPDVPARKPRVFTSNRQKFNSARPYNRHGSKPSNPESVTRSTFGQEKK